MARPKGQPKLGGRKAGTPNKNPRPLKELAQQYTEQALQCLVDIFQDKAAPHAARVSASKELLDRGHGKAVATQIISEATEGQRKTLADFYGSDGKSE